MNYCREIFFEITFNQIQYLDIFYKTAFDTFSQAGIDISLG